MNPGRRRGTVPIDTESPDLPDEYAGACLLMLLHERPCGGLELGERLGALGFPARPSQMAVTLGGLHRIGLVYADVAAEGPATYRLTAEGREHLGLAAEDLRATADLLGGFLARCEEWIVSDDGEGHAPAPPASGALRI